VADFHEQLLTEARRRFDSETQRLDELRSRSVNLLGFAAVAVGLLGVRTKVTHHTIHGTLVVAALVAFAGVVVLAVLINRPMPKWRDGEKLDRWIDWALAENPNVNHFEFTLARGLDAARTANAPLMRDRMKWLRWLCVVLAIQVGCGALAVLL
jgi:hypothetical protein